MLVKEVLVHSRHEAEVWFNFPAPGGNENGPPLGDPPRTLTHVAGRISQCANRVSPWEHAVVVRVEVRISAEEGAMAILRPAHSPRIRPAPRVAPGRSQRAAPGAGPPRIASILTPNTEARSHIGAELLR